MTIHLKSPDLTELKPRIAVIGVGGAGGNAVNNMIAAKLSGVQFIAANTDAQALIHSRAETRIQLGAAITEGLGAGSKPEIGAAAAEESIEEIRAHLRGLHMAFITAGMGGGTGTGAASVIAAAAREEGVLTVGVVTKPFHFEGQRRMRAAEFGIQLLAEQVDTLIVIPNQNLFRVAVVNTTFSQAFAMADQVLHDGIACITDVMVKDGIINLDFADVNLVMRGGGAAMMGTGEAKGENRGRAAAEAAISNPLLDDVTLQGARGLLISIIGAKDDLTLYEVDEAANRVREEVDIEANIIVGTAFDETLNGAVRVSVVATGLETRCDRAGDHQRTERAGEPVRERRLHEQAERARATEARPRVQAMAMNQADAGVNRDAAVRRESEGVRIERRAPALPTVSPISEMPRRAASTAQPLIADPTVRMPSIEDFPPLGQALLRQHYAGDSAQPAAPRGGLFGRLASLSGVKDSLLAQKERIASVAQAPQSSRQIASAELQIDPLRFDPHVKGGALSRHQQRSAQGPLDFDEDAEFPSFLRKATT